MDLRPASVVTLYLAPGLNVKLRPKLLAELKLGARVLSQSFDMDEWQPDSTVHVDGSPVYFWVVPADVAGTWNVAVVGSRGGHRYRVRFDQRFQRIRGMATAAKRMPPLTEAQLVGDSISFALRDTVAGQPFIIRFAGRIAGHVMSGTTVVDGSAERRAWRAARVRGERAGASGSAAAESEKNDELHVDSTAPDQQSGAFSCALLICAR